MYETAVRMYEPAVITQRREVAWERSEEIWLFVESNPVGAVLVWVRVDVDGIAIFVPVPRMLPSSHVEVDSFGYTYFRQQ